MPYDSFMVETFKQAQQSLHELVKSFAGTGQGSIHGEPSLLILVQGEVPVDFEFPTSWKGFPVEHRFVGEVRAFVESIPGAKENHQQGLAEAEAGKSVPLNEL